jgi:transcriptional regulator with XRE-family HTH domain
LSTEGPEGGHAAWLRGLLIAERNERKWSLEQTARAIGRELGRSLTKQSLNAWELGEVVPKVDQFAAWASALGLQLDLELVRPREDQVTVRLPAAIAPIARELTTLSSKDVSLISELVRRLNDSSG